MAYKKNYLATSGSGSGGANSRGAYWANKKKADEKKAAMPKKEYRRLTNPSQFQLDIFRNISSGKGHTVVAALAGSGKTSTIVEGIYHIPDGKSFILVAFNKAIADELRERLPLNANGDAGTSHSISFRAVKRAFGNVQINKNKVQEFAQAAFGKEPEQFDLINQICKAVGLCKSFLYSKDNLKQIDLMIDEYGIETDFAEVGFRRETFIESVLSIMELCKKQTKQIDFDDMLWFSAVHDLKMDRYDIVFSDESQDLSPLNLHLIKKMIAPGGRLIAVGDRNQAIYAFRGADKNSIDNIISGFDCTVLPLSVTYRCARAIVKEANAQVPELLPCDSAEDGTVDSVEFAEMMKSVRPGDAIISRTNAPMIGIAMRLIRESKPANIRGRDIGANLMFFVKKSKCRSVAQFIEYVQNWRDKEVERINKKNGNPDPVTDKAACLIALSSGAREVSDITDQIGRLFNDVEDDQKILLTSCHRAKGSEWEHCYMLSPTFRPGTDPQENNLVYVAKTRAKRHLTYVTTLKTEEVEG